jgi:WD40 repeat protein
MKYRYGLVSLFFFLLSLAFDQINAGAPFLYDIHWSPDGSRVLVVGRRIELYTSKLESLGLEQIGSQEFYIDSASWSPDSQQFVTASDHSISLWDASSLSQLKTVTYDSREFRINGAIIWRTNSNNLFARGWPQDDISQVGLYEWDAKTLELNDSVTLNGTNRRFLDTLSLSPDNTKFAYVYFDDKDIFMRVISSNTGDLIKDIPIPRYSDTLLWYDDNRKIVASSYAHIDIYDTDEGELISNLYVLDNDEKFIFDMAWSPDGQYLAIASDGNLEIWDTVGSQLVRELFQAEGNYAGDNVQVIDWQPSGTNIAVAYYSGGVQLFDVSDLTE